MSLNASSDERDQAPGAGREEVLLAAVVDLTTWRARRLATPWPGWWGDAELRSWTWAERSRRPA
jgi:hypothetical protein